MNLSGKTLGDDTLIEFVEAAFRKRRVPQHHICFEITERAAIANPSQAGKFINWFRQHGCVFSLDDFGTGMSSFSYLKHLQVDFIKIDGIFVKDILQDPIEAMLIAINNIGQVMGLRTVAEFVENQAILAPAGTGGRFRPGLRRPQAATAARSIGTEHAPGQQGLTAVLASPLSHENASHPKGLLRGPPANVHLLAAVLEHPSAKAPACRKTDVDAVGRRQVLRGLRGTIVLEAGRRCDFGHQKHQADRHRDLVI